MTPIIAFAQEAERLITEARKEAAKLHEEITRSKANIKKLEKGCLRHTNTLKERHGERWTQFQRDLQFEK